MLLFLLNVFLVIWLFELLIRVPIRFILFLSRVRSISVPNPRSHLSVSESAFGHYPLCSESDKKMVEDIVKAKSDPIRSVYIPIRPDIHAHEQDTYFFRTCVMFYLLSLAGRNAMVNTATGLVGG
jgi:hypothetical protein